MKVLVVGGGGREAALVWKLSQSSDVHEIFCAPGNAGIAQVATCVSLDVSAVSEILSFAKKNKIDLTIVGPEASLALGIVDAFKKAGLSIFGPTQKAARLESSKAFAKEFCERYKIPQAPFSVFDRASDAKDSLKNTTYPLVIKADGLKQGKGVYVCQNFAEALEAISVLANEKIVVEEFLKGEEASFLVFCDGNHLLPLASSQDHKRIGEGDTGPNTGGMGAYSPAPVVTKSVYEKIMEKIMLPAVRGMVTEGCPFVGILYAGLMIHHGEPRLLEFNVRFGDPEAQALLARLKSDLVEVMEHTVHGTLNQVSLHWDPRPSVCVVMASGGYPGAYEKGTVISGLDRAAEMDDVIVFHAGTKIQEKEIVTDGGRVLGVTALGKNYEEACQRAYEAVSCIHWEGAYYRKDIGKRVRGDL